MVKTHPFPNGFNYSQLLLFLTRYESRRLSTSTQSNPLHYILTQGVCIHTSFFNKKLLLTLQQNFADSLLFLRKTVPHLTLFEHLGAH